MSRISPILFIAGSAFIINILLTPLIIQAAHRFRWYDTLDHRKIHVGDMPRLGGIGLFLSFLIASILSFFLHPSGDAMILQLPRLLPILAGMFMIHMAGLVDDFTSLRAIYKFLIQLLAAILVASSGYIITDLAIPFVEQDIPMGIFAWPLTILWLVGMSNAVNLVDGMDGLAGGISAFAALFLGLVSLMNRDLMSAMLSFALFGSLLGFLMFNYPPAKIFMGDSGALFLGFALAVLPLVEADRPIDTVQLVVPITLLMIPLLDTAAAILRRIIQRRPIHSPDREHIHHRLLDAGLRPRTILMIVYASCILLGFAALAWVDLGPDRAVSFIMFVWCMSVGAFQLLDIARFRRRHRLGAAALPGMRNREQEESEERIRERTP